MGGSQPGAAGLAQEKRGLDEARNTGDRETELD